ncbi:MAG: MerR family transcriptional regulator [Gammaproteobacteria bacterium]|nr:MerR family transcriptional regulator [Gammaproteobacteria bacterium]
MSKKQENAYGIGAVARLTGISTHALRVWEKRHNAVAAGRTETGRRFYTPQDVERLSLMKRPVDRGQTISRIASLSQKKLEQRLTEFEDHATQRLAGDSKARRIAVYGQFLGLNLDEALAGHEIVARATRMERFNADIRQVHPDTLVIEVPIVSADTRKQVAILRRDSNADLVIAVYGIGRQNDIELLARDCDAVYRGPVAATALTDALGSGNGKKKKSRKAAVAAKTGGAAIAPGKIPARLFTSNQLARLATISTDVDCECPTHLVELVDRLSLFEEYSASCENRNKEDAALHALLHAASAQARSLIETALDRVIEAENLQAGPP